MSDLAVEVEILRKRYGKFEALNASNLAVPTGSIFGLLGPNGAGKSTLVKSLLTIVRPNEKRGRVLGAPIGQRKVLSRIGYLPEQAKFQDYLTGREVITYSGRLANVPSSQIKARIEELLPLVGMEEWADKPVGTYSKGMRQRIGLAQALVNSPDLVFLDEPTDGVDPGGRIDIRRIIEKIRAEGRTVLLNSHLLSEVEVIADHVAILVKGKLVRSGSIGDFTHGGGLYTITTVEPIPLDLRERLSAEKIEVAGNLLKLKSQEPAGIQPVIDALRAVKLTIKEVKEHRSSLEDIFLQTVQGEGEVSL